MTRIASAAAAAGLLAGTTTLAFAAGDSSGAGNPPNVAPQAQTAPAARSGSTQPAATARRHAARHEENSPEAQRMTKALNTLEAAGYGAFSNFRPSGKDFSATVTKDGREVTVLVDPDTGEVRPQG